MICFPDVNVWISLIVVEHIHHRTARAWYERGEWDALIFSRVTQMGVLRLLTNAHVMGRRVVSAHGAWAVMDELRANQSIRMAAEPPGLEIVWRELLPVSQSGSNFWTDAYLAAFARTAGYTLVTFDRAFAKYKNTQVKLLATESA